MVQAFEVLGVVHIGVAALIVAGYVLSLSASRIHPLMVWAARSQLLLGLILVGLHEGAKSAGQDVEPLDHAWVAAKLVVALAVVACCEMAAARRRKGTPTPALMHTALGLTLVNVLVAYAFRG